MGIQPDKVGDLLKLLHDIPESIPPEQFQEYIEIQKSQIERSKEEIESLQERLPNQKSNLDTAIKEEGTTLDELKQFSSFKTVMTNNVQSLKPSMERRNADLIHTSLWRRFQT
jgi:chromosome segregation ATPase